MLLDFDAAEEYVPGAHPASYMMDTGFLPGGKAARVWQ